MFLTVLLVEISLAVLALVKKMGILLNGRKDTHPH